MERCLDLENTTRYLKNHYTKHRLVCTHFDAFSMLMPDMEIIFNNSEIFKKKFKKKERKNAEPVNTVLGSHVK